MKSRCASIAVAIFAVTTLATPPVQAASPKPAVCRGISAERASRLNRNYHGQGTLVSSAGEVTIQTPCGPVICRAGGGHTHPSNPMLDGERNGQQLYARICSWAPV